MEVVSPCAVNQDTVCGTKACVPVMQYKSVALDNPNSILARETAFKNYVDTTVPTRGYCSVIAPLSFGVKNGGGIQHSNHLLCAAGSSNDIMQRFTIGVYEPSDNAKWRFDMAFDAGLGLAIFVDGVLAFSQGTDIWPRFTMTLSQSFPVSKGIHTIEIYGGERCCDGEGNLDWQVTRNVNGADVSPMTMSAANLQSLFPAGLGYCVTK
jgi:hypothetical protein